MSAIPLEHVQATADDDDGAPSPEEQAEFFQWAELVKAKSVLENGLHRGDPYAIEFVTDLSALLWQRPRRTPKALPPPVPDGQPPF